MGANSCALRDLTGELAPMGAPTLLIGTDPQHRPLGFRMRLQLVSQRADVRGQGLQRRTGFAQGSPHADDIERALVPQGLHAADPQRLGLS